MSRAITDAKRVDRSGPDREPSRRSSTGLSVVIPTYNERPNVLDVVQRCLSSLAGYDAEVLVVDDDSPDGTAAFARDAFGDDERVRVIRRTEDRGLAQSVTRGFHDASHEFCAVIDADLQHPPEKLPELVEELEDGADVAVGSRHVDEGGIENWSRSRRLVSWGATTATRAVLPAARGCSDPLSGFFAVRREVVDGVRLDPKGYKILLEVVTRGDYETVVEVPYVFTERERGESKLTAGEYKKFVEHLGALAATSYGLDRVVDPYRAVRAAEFGTVGALGTVVNVVAFSAVLLLAGAHYLAAGVVAFLLALNFNFAGNWALTFDQPSAGIASKYLRFHAVSVAGFVLYMGLLAGLVGGFGVRPLLGNVIAIAGASVFNFIGSEVFAFGVAPSYRT